MLILTRKKEETIIIDNTIEVTILHIGKDQIKIGINAPLSIPVYRKEVYDAICNENRQASQTKCLDIKSIHGLFAGCNNKKKSIKL
ncbi:MAG: carbon storage regulator [Candidatus Schekmanbacteria bacterium RBG_13_48_7]|uniref:Translational regulator CsrA n=1 Tax=Candidatus Schekmanbacteria bacterium RBG_13_48_7 TaxID=1817878 RepID=A0A1F7RKC0_9BACT|nr:MAG: carbon storage regulator [Candidatus Schekmanbacteria bacterium RBG_13_48_7]